MRKKRLFSSVKKREQEKAHIQAYFQRMATFHKLYVGEEALRKLDDIIDGKGK